MIPGRISKALNGFPYWLSKPSGVCPEASVQKNKRARLMFRIQNIVFIASPLIACTSKQPNARINWAARNRTKKLLSPLRLNELLDIVLTKVQSCQTDDASFANATP